MILPVGFIHSKVFPQRDYTDSNPEPAECFREIALRRLICHKCRSFQSEYHGLCAEFSSIAIILYLVGIYLRHCLFLSFSVSLYLFACLSVCLSVCLSEYHGLCADLVVCFCVSVLFVCQ